jgi:hypothetical protein
LEVDFRKRLVLSRHPSELEVVFLGRGRSVGAQGGEGSGKAVIKLVLPLPVVAPSMLHDASIGFHTGLHAQLLLKFAVETVGEALIRLDVAAGEKGVGLAVGLHEQDVSGLLDDGAGEQVSGWHCSLVSVWEEGVFSEKVPVGSDQWICPCFGDPVS